MNKHKKLNPTERSQECHNFSLKTLQFILHIHLFKALVSTLFGRFPSIFSKMYPCGPDEIVKGIMKRHLQKNWIHETDNTATNKNRRSKVSNDTITKSFCRVWVKKYNHYIQPFNCKNCKTDSM